MIAAAILLVAIGVGAVMLLSGGGGDDTSSSDSTVGRANSVPVVNSADGSQQTQASEETQGNVTTTAAPVHRCTAEFGRCVFIDAITVEGDQMVARYTTVGYDPKINGGPESRHIHFYFDTLPIDQAGSPAPGGWVVYDTDANGELIYRFPISSIPDGATKLCASVANVNHGLDEHLQDCVALPL